MLVFGCCAWATELVASMVEIEYGGCVLRGLACDLSSGLDGMV